MTAYELRRHLAAAHDVSIRGAPYDVLTLIHQNEHAVTDRPDHTHEETR